MFLLRFFVVFLFFITRTVSYIFLSHFRPRWFVFLISIKRFLVRLAAPLLLVNMLPKFEEARSQISYCFCLRWRLHQRELTSWDEGGDRRSAGSLRPPQYSFADTHVCS